MKRTPHVFRETRFRLPSGPEREMALWVDRIGFAPGGTFSPERLRLLGQFAAVAVDAGRGTFFSPAAGRLTVTTGDVMLLFPDEPSSYGASPDWQTRWIVWNGPEAAKVVRLGDLSPRQPVIRGGLLAVQRAFAGLAPLMQAESFPALLERKRLVLGLLADLLALRQAGADSDPGTNRIAALLKHLDDPDAALRSIPSLAAECHLSASQFRRLFRAHTGRSPVEFLTARRIAQAKELLTQGLPMKDVALRTGYADVFYFMRVFRRTAGQTVGQFVRQNAPGGGGKRSEVSGQRSVDWQRCPAPP